MSTTPVPDSTEMGFCNPAPADQALGLVKLRSFIGLANTLHFGHAARKLHVTQSALSQQIAALERSLGTRLFSRGARGVVLTRSGSAFLRYASEAMERLDQAVHATRGVAGELRVENLHVSGAEPDGFVDALVAAVLAQTPDLRLDPLPGPHCAQVRALRSYDTYLAVLTLPYQPTGLDGVRLTVLGQGPSALVVRPEHPLAAETSVSLARVADLGLWGPPSAPQRYRSDAWLRTGRPQRLDVAPAYWAADPATLVSELPAGPGAFVAPLSLAARVPRGLLSFVPLAGGPPAVTALAWPRWVSSCEMAQLTPIALAVWSRSTARDQRLKVAT